LFWDPSLDSTVLAIRAAAPTACDDRAFDIFRQPCPVTHLRLLSGREEVLVGRGPASLRLSIVEGTLLAGPVMLQVHIHGAAQLDRSIASLTRLVQYLRHGRITPPKARSDRSLRRGQVLQVLDALAAGASHRDIARGLFGVATVDRDWNGSSDHMRSKTRRLVILARRLAAGGYLDLLAAPCLLPRTASG